LFIFIFLIIPQYEFFTKSEEEPNFTGLNIGESLFRQYGSYRKKTHTTVHSNELINHGSKKNR